jgi:predicted transcriptional regulator
MANVTVQEVVNALGLEVVAGADHLDNEITGGYASDLLSCVMAGAAAGNAWVTLQAHLNVIAVAALLDLACVIVTEGAQMDAAAVARADEKGIPTLLTERGTYVTVAQLVELGINGSR